jgi:hypothetical protein
MTPIEIVKALDLIADYYHPRFGRWAYRAFDAVNTTFFEGRLPRPLIQWGLTPHGHCLGLTAIRDRPIITLHPSIMEPRGDRSPWGVKTHWLGPVFAFDVLLHESIHVAQAALYGPESKGETSHNCPSWIAEVNRLAPLLGLHDVHVDLNRPRRVPIPGQITKTGKPQTRVQRVEMGNVPLSAHARFPYGVRQFLGTAADYYRRREFPCGIKLDEDCNP